MTWRETAACSGHYQIMMAAYRDYAPHVAIALCRSCPVLTECGFEVETWREPVPSGVAAGLVWTAAKTVIAGAAS